MEIQASEGAIRVSLVGDWTMQNLAEIRRETAELTNNGSKSPSEIDCTRLSKLDTVGASEIWTLSRIGAGVRNAARIVNLKSQFHSLIELIQERFKGEQIPKRSDLSLLQAFGKSTIEVSNLIASLVAFIGETALAFKDLVFRPTLFRAREFAMQIKVVCIDAIPIVSLVTFLIGMVVAYLSAIQIEKFGANIFLVDAVSLGLCRELSPVLVAVVVAGRSGSAFTAQIGTMKLNEEIDAITTLGLSPMQVLVLPRIIALVLMMPLLVFVGDISGLLGSMLVANTSLGLGLSTFIERLQIVLTMKSFFVGLIKAPAFAAVIAMIGCKMGLSVENNARSIGLHTTSTVVQSIVAVILMNAAFAVIFQKLGI